VGTVRIQKNVLQAIIHHAQAEAPRECCGLLSGEADVITRHQAMRNILSSRVRYEMDSRELFAFFKDLRVAQRAHLGIYHSHPASHAYPSRTDIDESFYPDCAYFIVSLKDPANPQVRAFRIVDGSVEELRVIEV
jgi:proteasome lid subunit RPN8/RPN11